MADLSQIIVLFVCVMAFVLLTIACAGNSWVVAYDDSISFGLWKYCITGTFNSECLPISKLRKTDSWHDGARAMSVISILVAAFTSLACLARIFLEDNEIIKKVGILTYLLDYWFWQVTLSLKICFHLFLFGISRHRD